MFTPGLTIFYLATILRLEAGEAFLRLPGRILYMIRLEPVTPFG